MTEQTQAFDVKGQVWLNDLCELSDSETLLEMEDGRIVVERTDEDEIAIHFVLGGDTQAMSSIYTNRMGAYALMGLLQMEAAKP
jgi:hypothetical protein